MEIEADWNNLDKDQFLRKYTPIAGFFLIFILIMAELFTLRNDLLTWQLIALIALLIAIPYVPLIKRVSYGEWEAELATLVEAAEEEVESPGVSEKDTATESRAVNLEKMLDRQLEEDPKIALAKLRIELENVLTEFAEDRGFEPEGKYILFRDPLEFLRKNEEVMDQSLYNDIQQVERVANKAIHGGEVSRSTTRRIINVGMRVLERLYQEADRSINPDPSIHAFRREE